MPQPSSSSTKPIRPSNWLPEHDAFIRRHARHGEDATTIVILFETEYSAVRVVILFETEY
ncbi:hypothetical protein A1O3_06213 [Capronia epimyces CBS 606.96]|uniref:Uncharacterized protein n=1 Tax=Capronia epimyces CBS 606.96 TaxID=1182542 RepID=W9XYH4_9EURO|nr:uncharacterized protein A1O3_06213 [Capronia epimyces CBS 606.96]EXJ82400.1 hypothetical protein A1O3_06213 [Capronia epimyces CBS 606.96]